MKYNYYCLLIISMHQLMHPVYAELTRLINTCINYASYMSQFRLISANRKGTSDWTHTGSHCLNYAVVTKFKLNQHCCVAHLQCWASPKQLKRNTTYVC